MKNKMLFLLAFLATSVSQAAVSECNQTEKLTCQISYNAYGVTGLQVINSAPKTSGFFLIVDDPSSVICTANITSNENHILVNASLSSEMQLSLGVQKTVNQAVNDSLITEMKLTQDQPVKSTIILRPAVKMQLNGQDVEIQSAEIKCSVTK